MPRTRASHGSSEVLNELLEHEDCDVDYTNRLEGATPLHLAVKIKDPELRAFITDCLLDAGANMLYVRITLMLSLPPILTLVPVVSRIKRVKCLWIMYPKTTMRRGTHSAAVRFKIAFRETTLLMVCFPWLCGA